MMLFVIVHSHPTLFLYSPPRGIGLGWMQSGLEATYVGLGQKGEQ